MILVPAIMFHGTADPNVPFNSGFPFTLDIALPIVYGSNLIHDRLDEVGIENELYAESGLLHEYWGTLNGNWFGGPNEYFDQIQTDAYSFLYDYLDCCPTGFFIFVPSCRRWIKRSVLGVAVY